jgi:hypothetical protein
MSSGLEGMAEESGKRCGRCKCRDGQNVVLSNIPKSFQYDYSFLWCAFGVLVIFGNWHTIHMFSSSCKRLLFIVSLVCLNVLYEIHKAYPANNGL